MVRDKAKRFLCLWAVFIAFSLFSIPEVFAAITWEKIYYANDQGGPVLPTADGGYISLGRTRSFGQWYDDVDVWLLKLNAIGTPQWQKVFGNAGRNWANDLQVVSGGGYVITGGGFVMKVTTNGDIEWQKNLLVPGRFCDGIAIQGTSDGGFVVLATVTIPGYSSDSTRQDFWVVKFDSDGDIEWQKLFDKQQHDIARDIRVVSDNGYILTGFSYNNNDKADVWILKIDSQGAIEWQNLYGGSLIDFPHKVLEADNGDFIVAGTTPSSFPGLEYPWVMRLRTNGEILWQQKYDQLREVRAGLTIVRGDEGRFLLAGNQTGGHLFLMEIDSTGYPLWLKTENGYLLYINKTMDSGYIFSRELSRNIYISKVDSMANSCRGKGGHYPTSKVDNDFQRISSPVTEQNIQGYVTELNFIARDTSIIPTSLCSSALPEIFIDASALNYGFDSVTIGEASVEQALVANDGGTDLEIKSITVNGPATDQFLVTSNCASIAPGASCIISVTFTPTSLGAKSAILTINSSDPNQPSIEIPLSGQGIDTIPPMLSLMGENVVVVEAGTPYVDAGATAYDSVDGDLTEQIVATNMVNTSATGTYTITYEVSDRSGNQALVTRTVQVMDTIPPVVSLSADRTLLWPPNRKLVDVLVAGGAADSGSGVASVEITVADEYGKYDVPLSGFGSTVALEAWREGTDKDGRIYTLTAVVTDQAGNISSASAQVLVPHDMRK